MTWSPAPCNDRFDPVPGEKTMKAVVTAGNGGFEKLPVSYTHLTLPTTPYV